MWMVYPHVVPDREAEPGCIHSAPLPTSAFHVVSHRRTWLINRHKVPLNFRRWMVCGLSSPLSQLSCSQKETFLNTKGVVIRQGSQNIQPNPFVIGIGPILGWSLPSVILGVLLFSSKMEIPSQVPTLFAYNPLKSTPYSLHNYFKPLLIPSSGCICFKCKV